MCADCRADFHLSAVYRCCCGAWVACDRDCQVCAALAVTR